MQAGDGVRLRAACWPGGTNGGTKGTVFMLAGRNEHCEKYGRVAAYVTQRGYAFTTIDWRGQGLADRLTKDPLMGHVRRFSDYQLDLAAWLEAARAQNLPQPYYMIGHSMGGCIGLRALHNNLPFQSAVFSAPMWGVAMPPILRPVSWLLSPLMTLIGLGHWRVIGTSPDEYMLSVPFEDNKLTTDRDQWDYVLRQKRAISGIGLGSASFRWLWQGLMETRKLRALGPSDHDVITFLGSQERIVDTGSIKHMMARWENGLLVELVGAEHELPIEQPVFRDELLDAALELFDKT